MAQGQSTKIISMIVSPARKNLDVWFRVSGARFGSQGSESRG